MKNILLLCLLLYTNSFNNADSISLYFYDEQQILIQNQSFLLIGNNQVKSYNTNKGIIKINQLKAGSYKIEFDNQSYQNKEIFISKYQLEHNLALQLYCKAIEVNQENYHLIWFYFSLLSLVILIYPSIEIVMKLKNKANKI